MKLKIRIGQRIIILLLIALFPAHSWAITLEKALRQTLEYSETVQITIQSSEVLRANSQRALPYRAGAITRTRLSEFNLVCA